MTVYVLLKQGLLPVLVIDFTNQTDLVEHDTHNDSFQSLGSFCSLANGLLTMTFCAFLVVIDIQ